MPETIPPPDLAGMTLAEIAALAAARRLPPVETWHPARCGDSEMRIARDGRWFHQGTPIARPAMVRLFSTLLRREADGSYALVTPVERLSIAVEDAPFVAVALIAEGSGRDRRLAFRLNTGDPVVAGATHPIGMEDGAEGARPHVVVRPGIVARIARPVYYELAEMALAEGAEPPGLWSDNVFFRLDAAT